MAAGPTSIQVCVFNTSLLLHAKYQCFDGGCCPLGKYCGIKNGQFGCCPLYVPLVLLSSVEKAEKI
jgi:hypothetical protein